MPHAATIRRLGRYAMYLGALTSLVVFPAAFLSDPFQPFDIVWGSFFALVGLFGYALEGYGIARTEPTPDFATVIWKHKSAQAIFLLWVGFITSAWVLQVVLGRAEGTVDQVGAMFFVGLGSIIFGGYRANQLIRSSAEAGGFGKHITRHNFGFVLILVALCCWYLAWQAFEALGRFPPRPTGGSAVGAELAAQNQMFLGGLVGFLFLLMGVGLVNPSKSQYRIDIERHGRSRRVPRSVMLEVWQRDGGRCVMCGSTEDIHFDHIIPYSKGGSSDDPGNIQVLCSKCNLQKHANIQ